MRCQATIIRGQGPPESGCVFEKSDGSCGSKTAMKNRDVLCLIFLPVLTGNERKESGRDIVVVDINAPRVLINYIASSVQYRYFCCDAMSLKTLSHLDKMKVRLKIKSKTINNLISLHQ